MVHLIICAVSGTGKSTIARRLLERYPQLRLSVSHTTRAPRAHEGDGVHYHFTSRMEFERLAAADEFAEWAEYAGNLYGTSRSMIAGAARDGVDLLYDIDVVGAANLKRAYPDALTCFVLPPSWAEVERRLRARGTESEASIARRLAAGHRELEAARGFDYLVLNEQLDAAVAELDCIYRAAHLRTPERRDALERLVARGG
jgi:guanylate kinase